MSHTSWTPHRTTIPDRLRRTILRRDNHTCQQCAGNRCGNLNLEVDHRIPVAEGGTNDPANLWTLGANPCHTDKTEAERRRGIARKNPRRTPPPHPGTR